MTSKSKFLFPNDDLLLDLDGVIVQFNKRVIKLYNERHDGNLTEEQWTKFEVSEVFGNEIWAKMEKIYNEEGFFSSLEPYPGSLEVIREVMKLVPVFICSAPTKRINSQGKKELNPHSFYEKIEWIHSYLPELSNDVYLMRDKHKVRAKFLVDDGLHNIRHWCARNPKSYAFVVARLWNENCELPENAVRASLEELPDFIKSTLS